MLIMNAANASYIDGWRNYQVVVSYDRNTWFRVDSEYENGELIIRHTPEQYSVFMHILLLIVMKYTLIYCKVRKSILFAVESIWVRHLTVVT